MGGEGVSGKCRWGKLQLEDEADGHEGLEPATLEQKLEVWGKSRSPRVCPAKGAGPWVLVGRRSVNPPAPEQWGQGIATLHPKSHAGSSHGNLALQRERASGKRASQPGGGGRAVVAPR